MNKKQCAIRTFLNPGDNNLLNTAALPNNKLTPYLPKINSIDIRNVQNDIALYKFYGYCEMFDQEPIDLVSLYESSKHNMYANLRNMTMDEVKNTDSKINPRLQILQELNNPIDFISYLSAGVHLPLVCHSEKNSASIKLLSEHNFIPIHYWYHAYISLDWFKHYKYLNINNNISKHKFGIYIRDISNVRAYRLNILKELCSINNQVYYNIPNTLAQELLASNNKHILSKWNKAHTDINSNSSATIDWPHCNYYDIQIVAETLFNTEKTHLTEKICKPIVMGQPFIVFSGPNSLKYIQDYGFTTFGHLWDESYDLELDNNKRFYKIINLINDIASLSNNEYTKIFTEAKKIAIKNRTYFYSNNFETLLLHQLHSEIDNGLNMRNNMYYEIPGGTYFSIMNTLHEQQILPTNSYNDIFKIAQHIKLHDNFLYKLIYKKYKNLFISL